MKILKSFSLSVLTAASTLMFVAVSTPAQACGACSINLNGPILNGPVPQGPVLQGPILQGPILQGPVLQGPMLQGPAANGAHLGKFIAVTLPGGETIPVH